MYFGLQRVGSERLVDGDCEVRWQAMSDDGRSVTGHVAFTVTAERH